ncbi:MAG: ABC transporter ATP-binding protein, partial [Thermodesulfobacteriota bacterium]
NGRVSSILELGSGFHPEFTGLDNIYFYGSLLGIDKKLMEKKKREIIDFSEIGDFINFPLKTYSSGMLVRLAFSVATAIDPDILVVDEALSVGDLHFQKKSTDRILAFKEYGKTIIFCSHGMYHIARLCDRVLWLKNGKIHLEGKPLEVIQEYETYQLGKNGGVSVSNNDLTSETDEGTIKAPTGQEITDEKKPKIYIKSIQPSPLQSIRSGDDLSINIQTVTNDDTTPYRIAVKLMTVNGLDIVGIGTNKLKPFYGSRSITLLFPKIQLRSGTFRIEAFVFDEKAVYVYDSKEALPIIIPRESIEVGIVDLPHEWIID